MGGIAVLGKNVPIWTVILIEFICAYVLEIFVGSPLSFKLACKSFNPQETHPVIFETAVISSTVVIMCPIMSFIASILYYPFGVADFSIFTLLANWIKLVCYNLPFAFFSQIFFIQPLVRTIFGKIFARKRVPQGEMAV